MKSPYLLGEKVYLRGVEKEDLGKFVSWINDSEVTYYMFMGDRPAHLELLIEQWEKEIKNPNEVVFAVIDKKENIIVGSAGLYQINWISRASEYRIIIGDKRFWKKGYGTKIAELLFRYGFEKLNLNKIWLGVNSENSAAVRSYEKAGFIKEGILRQEIFRNNRFYDAIRMSILREEYEKQKKKM